MIVRRGIDGGDMDGGKEGRKEGLLRYPYSAPASYRVTIAIT